MNLKFLALIFFKDSKKCENSFSFSLPFQPWQSKYILYLIRKFGDPQDFETYWNDNILLERPK